MVDSRSDIPRDRSGDQYSEMCPWLPTAPYPASPYAGHRKECADTTHLATDYDAFESRRGQIGFDSLSVSSMRPRHGVVTSLLFFSFRNLMTRKSQLIQCFHFRNDDWNMVTYKDYHGQYQEQAALAWFAIFR